MPDPRRLRPADLLTALFLVLLALVARRPGPESGAGPASPPPPPVTRRAAPAWVHGLLAAAIVAGGAVVKWRFSDDGQYLGILMATCLGGLTLWSTWGLHVISTPGKPWHRWLVRGAIATPAVVLGAYFWCALGPEYRSDRASVLAFSVCTLFSVALEVRQTRGQEREAGRPAEERSRDQAGTRSANTTMLSE